MKRFRLMLLPIVVLGLASFGLAQDDAQKSFDQLKTLAGTWQGRVSLDPPQKDMANGDQMQISMRVTSRGNAMVHEMKDVKASDDPTRNDHPLTMFYVDNGKLLLTHYCDAGNRPRMVARTSPDGNTIDFDFVDVSGNTQYGHMQHATFTIIDPNHHTEDWTFVEPGDKLMRGHMDLQRVK